MEGRNDRIGPFRNPVDDEMEVSNGNQFQEKARIRGDVRGNAEAESMNSDTKNHMLTIREIAEMLRCSARTLYRLKDAGHMPKPIRIGKLIRWNRSEIEIWINAGCPRNVS